MEEYLSTRTIERGPLLKIFFNAARNNLNSREILTEIFAVHNMAKIRFKLQSKRVITVGSGNGINIDFQISSMKHEKAGDSTIKMNITCKELHFSKESVCSEDWLSWKSIGNLTFNDENPYWIEINIFTYKVETNGFAKLYDDTDLTDFNLHAEGGSVSMHKVCLAARSDAFKVMLTGQWKEKTEDRIQLKDVTIETLRHLKDYFYLGTLPSDDKLRPLLVLAARYFIEDLKVECVRKLAVTVEPDQLVSLHNLACEYNITELSIAISQLTADEVIHKAYCMHNSVTDSSSDDQHGEDSKSNLK